MLVPHILPDQVSWTRKAGIHNAVDIVMKAFELIKLYQLQLKKEESVELDCNKILEKAVEVYIHIYILITWFLRNNKHAFNTLTSRLSLHVSFLK